MFLAIDPTYIVIGIVVIVIVLFVFMWYIGVMNKLRKLEIKVDEAESGIDIALTKRFDVLKKMLASTKGYTKHESETFEKITKWRSGIKGDLTIDEKQQFQSKLNQVQASMQLTVEKYPDLKAEKMFTKLQNSISDVEEHLQAARRVYNANVTRINQIIVTFPSSIVANKINMTKKDFFEAESYKREDYEMEF